MTITRISWNRFCRRSGRSLKHLTMSCWHRMRLSWNASSPLGNRGELPQFPENAPLRNRTLPPIRLSSATTLMISWLITTLQPISYQMTRSKFSENRPCTVISFRVYICCCDIYFIVIFYAITTNGALLWLISFNKIEKHRRRRGTHNLFLFIIYRNVG